MSNIQLNTTQQGIFDIITKDFGNDVAVSKIKDPNVATMTAYNVFLAVLKTEIQTDPDGLGYAGKTNAQIAALLNGTYSKQQGTKKVSTGVQYNVAKDTKGVQIMKKDGLTPVLVPVPVMTDQPNMVQKDPRVLVILQGVGYAPNIVLEDDVRGALA